MTCPICGKQTKVTNSRTPDAPNGYGNLLREANKAVGWYTKDYVARTRVCSNKHTFTTVELTAADFDALCREEKPIFKPK